jgi:hypothetical protein
LFTYAFKASKSIAAGAIYANTVSCAVNIGVAAFTDEFISTVAFNEGKTAGALGWGGLASTTYGCVTLAWQATGYLAKLNNRAGVIGCGIGLAQTIYDLNGLVEDSDTDDYAKFYKDYNTFLRDWTGGVIGCSATYVALSL